MFLKIMNVENIGGLGVKRTKKGSILGTTITGKLMCQEFHQINGKGQVINRDFEN